MDDPTTTGGIGVAVVTASSTVLVALVGALTVYIQRMPKRKSKQEEISTELASLTRTVEHQERQIERNNREISQLSTDVRELRDELRRFSRENHQLRALLADVTMAYPETSAMILERRREIDAAMAQ